MSVMLKRYADRRLIWTLLRLGCLEILDPSALC